MGVRKGGEKGPLTRSSIYLKRGDFRKLMTPVTRSHLLVTTALAAVILLRIIAADFSDPGDRYRLQLTGF